MMNVDQKLRDLKDEYQSDIPTSFSEKDKQNIFKTISQDTYPKRPKLSQYFQKPAALVSYAAVIALIGILSIGQIGFEDTASPNVSSDHAVTQAGPNMKGSLPAIGGGSGEKDQQPNLDDKVDLMENTNIWNQLKIGEQYASMELSHLSKKPNHATFTGDLVLSGSVVKKDTGYKFHVSDFTKSKLPLMEDQKGMLIVDFENIDDLQGSLQKANEEEAFIKFIISEYHYRSVDEQIERSITVNGIILDGDYIKVNPQ